MTPNRQIFDDGLSLASQLAKDVAQILRLAIDETGRAFIAVSGGSTPARFFKALSSIEIEWDKVTIALVDERYVAPDNERSNEKCVRDQLMQGPAASANLIGFWIDGIDVNVAEHLNAQKIDALPNPFDVIILGMGPDGHTASFFPGGSNLQQALDQNCKQTVISMAADGAGEPRLTLTLPSLIAAKHLILHIEGQIKIDVLNQALEASTNEKLPIGIVCQRVNQPLDLYWAP